MKMNLGGTIRINRTGMAIIAGVCVLFTLYNLSFDKSLKTPDEQKAHPNSISKKKLLIAAINAAKLGGREVVQVYNDGDLQIKLKGKTKEGAEDRVTLADGNSHCAMYKGLQKTFPNIKIISEEMTKCDIDGIQLDFDEDAIFTAEEKNLLSTDSFVDSNRITMWIDPLDATQEFTEKLIEYVTTMTCVAIDGKPIIGVIHRPFTNETSWAWVGRIASKDLQIKQLKSENKPEPKIVVTRSHTGDVFPFLKKAFGENVNIMQAAGAGYKSLQVAHGLMTAYIHKTIIKKWDLCAGNAIINYIAGGQMTTFDNMAIDYSNGGKVVHDKGIVATLRDHDFYIQAIQKIEPQKIT